MDVYYKKKFLAVLPENNAGYLCRQLRKKRCRVRVSDGILVLQNRAALEAAKRILNIA